MENSESPSKYDRDVPLDELSAEDLQRLRKAYRWADADLVHEIESILDERVQKFFDLVFEGEKENGGN
jgi:hypothetical protein